MINRSRLACGGWPWCPFHKNNNSIWWWDNLPYCTLDLHRAGNHRDQGQSVTDGVCQPCTCSLCFHLAINPIESRCCRDQCTICHVVCAHVCVCVHNSSERLPVGHHFQSLPVSISLNIPVNWSHCGANLLSHSAVWKHRLPGPLMSAYNHTLRGFSCKGMLEGEKKGWRRLEDWIQQKVLQWLLANQQPQCGRFPPRPLGGRRMCW